MPPHCDSRDGPVVKAATRALEARDVTLVLPYVPADGEAEVIAAFEKVMKVRDSDGAVTRQVANDYFFETVVRVHRAGEGAPYTGLKPAGLDVGPVIPAAERAIETESPDQLIQLLTEGVRAEARKRFDRMLHLKRRAAGSVADAREYVESMLGLQVWSHRLYECARSEPHEGGGHGGGHHHG